MSQLQRKKFPMLALLAVLVLAVGTMFLERQLGLLPTRTEVWINLESAQVEFRYFICQFCISREQYEDRNYIYHQFTDSTAPTKDSNWVNSSTFVFWFHNVRIESTEYWDIELALLSMGKFAQKCEHKLGPQHQQVSLTSQAQDLLLQEFWEVFHGYGKPEQVRGFVKAISRRIIELGGEINADDIITSEEWFADPIAEHYYGPTRIY